MGFFSTNSRTESSPATSTLIAKGCHASGQLKVEGDIQIDGFVEGRIDVKGTLVVSQTGRIKGEVHTQKLIINGMVEGECKASNISVLAKGRLSAKVSCNELCIEPGGKFIGENTELPQSDVAPITSQQDSVTKKSPSAKKTA
ncbi:polymer-forming cytoskeletal protein [Vibrio sp. FNV 38]|nr:polymer-forming cytoskeletal protein [Vibrio sp. FNV 38]